MSSKHQKTFDRIFEKPVPSDIKFSDFVTLIRALGGIVDNARAGSRVAFKLSIKIDLSCEREEVSKNNEEPSSPLRSEIRAVFHEPHPEKTMKKSCAKSARIFLEAAGYKRGDVIN